VSEQTPLDRFKQALTGASRSCAAPVCAPPVSQTTCGDIRGGDRLLVGSATMPPKRASCTETRRLRMKQMTAVARSSRSSGASA